MPVDVFQLLVDNLIEYRISIFKYQDVWKIVIKGSDKRDFTVQWYYSIKYQCLILNLILSIIIL